MKKVLALIIFAFVVYFVFFSTEKTEITTDERVLDYDIKYKDAVKDINDAVDLNLEKHKLIEELDKDEEDSPE